jgi:hypothetical protein
MRYLALVLILSACASAHSPRIEYGAIRPFTLRHEPRSTVQEQWDKRSGRGGQVICFFDHRVREMWVSWGNESCVMHELCHAEGKRERECRKKVRGI